MNGKKWRWLRKNIGRVKKRKKRLKRGRRCENGRKENIF